MNIDIQELLNAKKEQLREKEQRLKELNEATKRLQVREILKKQQLDKDVLAAKNAGKQKVIDLIKSRVPSSPPSYFKPASRALLSDVHRIIAEEEETIKKSAKRT